MKEERSEVLRREEDVERKRHDELYAGEAHERDRLRMVPSDWTKLDAPGGSDSAYITSVKWLGDLTGSTVLDLGCGTGWLSVILAKRGAAKVEGFDISEEAVQAARVRAEVNDCSHLCSFVPGSCYDIPFPAETFDLVAGQAILHHVRDKEAVVSELYRVMRPGAIAVFYEPFGGVQWFERFRQALPFYSQTDDPEHWKDKFTYAQFRPFQERFSLNVQHFELLHGFSRYHAGLSAPLARLDSLLLRFVPVLRRFSRGVVFAMRKVDTDG